MGSTPHRYPKHWIPILPNSQQSPKDLAHVLRNMKDRHVTPQDLEPFRVWRDGGGRVPPNSRWHVNVSRGNFICGYGEHLITVLDYHMVPRESVHIPIRQSNGKLAASLPTDIRALIERYQKQGVSTNLHEYHSGDDGPFLVLSEIQVPKEKRNQGIGSAFMEELVRLADANQEAIFLTPSKDYGATSASRLQRFYARFGFVRNSGRNKDFRSWEAMVRRPKKQDTAQISSDRTASVKARLASAGLSTAHAEAVMRALAAKKKTPTDQTYYHSTPAGDAIRREGFKPSVQGELGPGVYVSQQPMHPHFKKHENHEILELSIPGVKLLHISADAPNTPLAILEALYGRKRGQEAYEKHKREIFQYPYPQSSWGILHRLVKEAGYDGIQADGSITPRNIVIFDPSKITVKDTPSIQSPAGAHLAADSANEAPKWLIDHHKRNGAPPGLVDTAWQTIQETRGQVAAENLRIAREKGFEITPDDNLVLYHGTRAGAAIRKSGYLRPGSYLSAIETDARRYAGMAQTKGRAEVFRLEVYPGYGFLQGNGYFTLREPVPVRDAQIKTAAFHLTALDADYDLLRRINTHQLSEVELPDGSIAYVVEEDPNRNAVYVVDRNGENRRRVRKEYLDYIKPHEGISRELVKKLWAATSPALIGTVGDFLTDPKLRKQFAAILWVPVWAFPDLTKQQHALGRCFNGGPKHIYIQLDTTADNQTFFHEMVHADRIAKGRSMLKVDVDRHEDSAERGQKYYAEREGREFEKPVRRVAEEQKPKLLQKKPKSITDTPAFKRWFAGSKVVDAQGHPVLMYHGTREPFTRVDMSRGAQGVFWLTSNLGGLERGEVGAASNKTILRCYVKITNPAGWPEYERYGLGELKRNGYDGVILSDPDGSFDAIVFKPNQVKILPQESEQKQAATPATTAFSAWFGKSKVVNPDGSPKVVYHGTGADIDEFKYDFTGQGNDQLGSGFYFTDSHGTASGYTTRQQSDKPKPGGEQANVMPVYLSIQNPIIVGETHHKFTPLELRKIIMAAPDLDDALWNFGDWQGEGKQKVIREAVQLYTDSQDPEQPLRTLFNLANDFYRDDVKEFNTAVKAATGYDGVISGYDNETHYVAWFPNQIKSAIGNNGKYDPKNLSIAASTIGDVTLVGRGTYSAPQSALDYEGTKFEKLGIQCAGRPVGEVDVQIGRRSVTVRNILIYDEANQRKGIGRKVYAMLAARYAPKTLRSSFNVNRAREHETTGLSQAAQGLWDQLTEAGHARRVESGDRFFYEMIPDEKTGDAIQSSEKPKLLTRRAAEQVNLEPILRELMKVLQPGLPTPEIETVNTKENWLGQCVWLTGMRNKYDPSTAWCGDNTKIRLQKYIMTDEPTLRRTLAHELAHHEDYLVNRKKKFKELGYYAYKMINRRSDGHGTTWRAIAARFNAVYGADFVTRTSDERDVIDENIIKPFYILLHLYSDGVIRAQQFSVIGVPQRRVLAQRQQENADAGKDIFKLFKIKDPDFMNAPPLDRYGGFAGARDEEGRAKLKKLWEEGDNLLPQFTSAHDPNQKPYFVLMGQYLKGKLAWQHALSVTPIMKEYLGRIRQDGNTKLFQTDDPFFLDSRKIAPKTTPRFSRTPEEQEKALKLWSEGQDLLPQYASMGKASAVKPVDLVYHNTQSQYLDDIKREGLDAGSFSSKPIDFGGDVWLAVSKEDLPEYQEHTYGNATAFEPAWEYTKRPMIYDEVLEQEVEDEDADGELVRHNIPADRIYVVTNRGRIISKLSEYDTSVTKQAECAMEKPKLLQRQAASDRPLLRELTRLRPAMAAAAQKVYDEWEQDEEGFDDDFGGGGICDEIASALSGVIASHANIGDLEFMDGGQDGDDHQWFIAYSVASDEAYDVDIPYQVYETGGGYSWTKRPDVVFAPEDIEITKSVVKVSEIAKEASGGAVDFATDPAWHDLFYGTPSPERIKELGSFLRSDPNRFIRLYHGTAAKFPVMQKGLLPTTASRRNSYQSGSGYVYLSVYPGMAYDFASMAFPTQPKQVYAVEVTARRLLADTDQLANKRHHADAKVGDTLAESLVVGHGARVKGKIDPFQIQPIDYKR